MIIGTKTLPVPQNSGQYIIITSALIVGGPP